MGKVTLLFAGKSYDTDVQNVRENQIVIFDGPYNMRQRMVVAGIAHTQSGYNYRLIDPETAEEHSADLIRPLRDKFGIGHYYDDEHPEFMDAAEVAALRTRADALKAEQEAARHHRRTARKRVRPLYGLFRLAYRAHGYSRILDPHARSVPRNAQGRGTVRGHGTPGRA